MRMSALSTEALECDQASLFLVDWKHTQLVCYNFRTAGGGGADEAVAGEVRIGMDTGLAAQCARQAMALNIADAYKCDHFNTQRSMRSPATAPSRSSASPSSAPTAASSLSCR